MNFKAGLTSQVANATKLHLLMLKREWSENEQIAVQAGHGSQARLPISAKSADLKASPHQLQLILFYASSLQSFATEHAI